MATITVRSTKDLEDSQVDVNPAVSILNTLLRSGISIRHVCGGRALCGTCRVLVVSGAENLSPMKDDERKRLKSSASGKYRLACQTYAFGDIVISIPTSTGLS